MCRNEADAYLKKENREKHEASGAMWWNVQNKHKIDVWTSGLDFESSQGVGDEPLSFHIAGSVFLLLAHAALQRPYLTSPHVGLSC